MTTPTPVKTHTPLPWVANDQHSGSTPWRIESDACDYVNDGWVVAEFFGPDAKANAALIVRAVNSHYQLIEALECLIGHTDEGMKFSDRIAKATEALAKAKAGS